MKNIKKLLCMVLCAMSVIAMSVHPTFAASKTAKLPEKNTWFDVTGECYYKITLKSESLLTLYGTGSILNQLRVKIANSNKKDIIDGLSCYNSKTTSNKIALSKGTYYIHTNVETFYENSKKCQLKYSVKSIKHRKNFGIGSAYLLKKSTKETLYFTQDHPYKKYYKIRLTKNQKVTINSKHDWGFSIYDFDGNSVKIEDGSTPKLAKGTYYIVVEPNIFDFDFLGSEIVTFSWK